MELWLSCIFGGVGRDESSETLEGCGKSSKSTNLSMHSIFLFDDFSELSSKSSGISRP